MGGPKQCLDVIVAYAMTDGQWNQRRDGRLSNRYALVHKSGCGTVFVFMVMAMDN